MHLLLDTKQIYFYKRHIQFLISSEQSSRHNRCSIGTGQLVTHANNFLGQLVVCDELTDTLAQKVQGHRVTGPWTCRHPKLPVHGHECHGKTGTFTRSPTTFMTQEYSDAHPTSITGVAVQIKQNAHVLSSRDGVAGNKFKTIEENELHRKPIIQAA